MQTVRFAILGAGDIAEQMAATVSRMQTVETYAIASRDRLRAKTLAEKHGFTKAYGSYEELLADPRVDLVYIATPHNFHARQAIMCLKAGKHVLCEKPFTLNAREVLALSDKTGLLVADAMWPRYAPMLPVLREVSAGGIIGEVMMLTGNLGSPIFDKPRLRDPALGGGALLDLGIYTLTFAAIVMGLQIKDFSTSVVMSEDGVDMQNTVTLRYPDGKMASLYNTALARTDQLGMIYGTDGYAVVDGINFYTSLRLYSVKGELLSAREFPSEISGYEYEVQAAVEAIQQGQNQCAQYTHREIVEVMELMDAIRAEWGLVYPTER